MSPNSIVEMVASLFALHSACSSVVDLFAWHVQGPGWLPPRALLRGKICLVFFSYCMVFKRSQYVHNHIMLSGGGKHITYTSSSGALVLVWCGHSVTGMLFLTGLCELCNWGLFCILEGDPETPSDERRPSVQRWNRRPGQLCSNRSSVLKSFSSLLTTHSGS